MKNTKQSKERLERIRDLYSSALLASEVSRKEMVKNMEQYLGSDEIDGSSERAGIVRNVTFEMIESQISADIPVAKVDSAFYSAKREQNARSIERLSYAMRSRIPFEEINDKDERFTYIFGGSVFYLEWEDRDTVGTRSEAVRVHLISPLDFIPQPSISNIEDMDYCFLHFTTTRGELKSKYGVKEEELGLAECEYLANLDDPLGDAVAIIICFYRDADGRIGKFVFSGELILDDLPDYYKRKIKFCESCGKSASLCSCQDPQHRYRDLDFETVTFDGKRINVPYYLPKDFPIIVRKNTLGQGTLLGGSDCQRIRPQQQAINKIESRIMQKLLRAGITPIMPEGTSVTLSNAVFGQIIRTRPGESIDSYGKIDTTPDISQDIEAADRLYDHAKRVLGISDALQGTDSIKSESGYARELKIARASSRLETKKRMKQLAYCKLYRLIFQHYLAFSDEPRTFAERDTLGRTLLSEFNRYDFIEKDNDGNYFYYDSYLFTADRNADTQYQSENIWESNLQNLEHGTLGKKDEPAALLRYWQLQDKAHYPYARENVEYFQDILDKQNNTKNNYESENINEQKEGK